MMADQTRKCVDILLCIEGECQQIGRVCPDEETDNANLDANGYRGSDQQ